MPSFIKQKWQDKLWLDCKNIVSKQYPNVKVGTPKYWKLVVGVFKKAGGLTASGQHNY
jgi:hypothetical protein